MTFLPCNHSCPTILTFEIFCSRYWFFRYSCVIDSTSCSLPLFGPSLDCSLLGDSFNCWQWYQTWLQGMNSSFMVEIMLDLCQYNIEAPFLCIDYFLAAPWFKTQMSHPWTLSYSLTLLDGSIQMLCTSYFLFVYVNVLFCELSRLVFVLLLFATEKLS